MCYAKPGPRCDSVAKKRLAVAEQRFAADPSDQNQYLLDARKHDYFLTRSGIQDLRDQGKGEYADRFQQKRDDLIAESKFLSQRTNSGKWSQVPLKEMDSGALTMALLEAAEDESIDWGTSSPKDFRRAINMATFWHRDQTRANRGNLPRTPYIEHPLRNAMRAYRWGCTDGETMTAIVLHDTVEDCANQIANDESLGPHEARAKALSKIKGVFGEPVASIVECVSNPIRDRKMTKEEKRIAYRDHVRESISDPKVFVTKFADFADNAGGLHHNYIEGQEGMVVSMYKKYSLVVPEFRTAYENLRNDLPMGSAYRLRRTLAKVEHNLSRLGQRLSEDGHL